MSTKVDGIREKYFVPQRSALPLATKGTQEIKEMKEIYCHKKERRLSLLISVISVNFCGTLKN